MAALRNKDAEYAEAVINARMKDVADGLQAFASIQRVVSGLVPGAIPAPGVALTKEQLRSYSLAMIVEIGEWLQTLEHKSWKPGGDVTLKEPPAIVMDEFADILAFLGILIHYMEVLGMDPFDLAQAYVKKSYVNVHRFEENWLKAVKKAN
jgi:hypothetical protein